MTIEKMNLAANLAGLPTNSRWRWSMVLTGRLLTIVILVWTSWWAANNWLVLMRSSSATAARTGAEPLTSHSTPRSAELLMGPGQWSFAGGDWEVSLDDLPAKQLAARLERLPSTLSPQLPPQTDDERHLLEMLDRLPFERLDGGAWRRYAWRAEGLNAVVFVAELDGQDRLIAARVALTAAAGRCRLFSAEPNGQMADRSPLLLPWDDNATLIASRETDNGQRSCEIVSLSEAVDRAVARWRKAGWTVQGHPFVIDRRAWLCQRGAQCLSVSAIESDGHTLLSVVQASNVVSAEQR